MADNAALIAQLKRNEKAMARLLAANEAQAEATRLLAVAVHALADSLAACTVEDAGGADDETPRQEPDVPRYADGAPIGGG